MEQSGGSVPPWYHGPITRIAAELALGVDGDFLVRDCISSPGDFVLTCRWRGQPLHFKVNRTTTTQGKTAESSASSASSQEQAKTRCTQYQFEEEAFSAVPELIAFYWERQKPISHQSGAIIRNPIPKEGLQLETEYALLDSTRSHKALLPSTDFPSPPTELPPPPPPLLAHGGGEPEAEFFADEGHAGDNGQCGASPQLAPSPLAREGAPMAFRNGLLTSSLKRRVKSQTKQRPSKSLSVNSLLSASTEAFMRDSPLLVLSSTLKRSPSDSALSSSLNPQSPPPNIQATFFRPTIIKDVPKKAALDAGLKATNPCFPSDISLPGTGQRSPPTESPYDVPSPKPRCCLTERQIEFSPLYDKPRSLSKFKPIKGPPPPPPSRSGSGSLSSGGAGGNASIARKGRGAAAFTTAAEDSQSLLSELSSNTDTSYLEHRELTPLLSSDDNEESLAAPACCSCSASDPFPSGLPRGTQPSTSTSGSSEESCSSATEGDSSLLPPSPPPTTCHGQAPGEGGNGKCRSLALAAVRSVFDLDSFDPVLLPAENRPLDAAAVNTAVRLLLETPPKTLALYLAHVDADLLSIGLNRRYPGLPEDISSGLHLLTLVSGRQLREDVMERFLCLRLFVLVTIFAGTSPSDSARVLSAWTTVASECLSLGDYFGCYAVVSALSNGHLLSLGGLWAALASKHPGAAARLRGRLSPAAKAMNEAKEADEENQVLVPHVIPFVAGCRDLRGEPNFREVYAEIFQADASTSDCPLFRAHLAHLQHCLHRLDHYRQRAERIFAQFDAGDAQLRALFRTEFHLLLLWGRAGATGSTGGPRVYAKFGKVVAAMAAICQDRL